MNLRIFLIQFQTFLWWVLTPPLLRMQKILAWGQAVMQGVQWKSNAYYNGYMAGSLTPTPGAYNPTTTYTTGTQIIYWINGGSVYYGDNAIYEAISINPDGSNNAGFSGQAPSGTNVAPDTMPASITNAAQALKWLSQYNWVKVCPYPMGAYERASYSCQKIIYEYALNRWFNTTFRQPVAGISDIYITRNSINQNQFFTNGYNSSYVSPSGNTRFVSPSWSSSTQNNFTINIPIAVYNALYNQAPVSAGSNTPQRDGVVRAFADTICPAGAPYNIVTY